MKLSTAFITILRYCIPMCIIQLTCHVKEGNCCLYKNIYLLQYYYITTIECMLWLAAERARFLCDDWALLARCPRHLQSAFNLIVGIHAMVNWQLSKKGIHWPVSHDCITGSSVQLIEVVCFFKVICWPGIGFNWSQAQYFCCFILMELKRPYDK